MVKVKTPPFSRRSPLSIPDLHVNQHVSINSPTASVNSEAVLSLPVVDKTPMAREVHHHEITPATYRSLWKMLFDARDEPVCVWIVTVEGGHTYTNPAIPSDEIWIEDVVDPAERPFTLLREFTERNLLKVGGVEIAKAQLQAKSLESTARKKYADAGKKSFDDAFYKGNLFGLEDLKTRPDRGEPFPQHERPLARTAIKSVRGVEPPAELERESPEHEKPPPRRLSIHAPAQAPKTASAPAQNAPLETVSKAPKQEQHRPTIPSPQQAPRTPQTPPPALPGTDPALTPAGRQPGPKPRQENEDRARSQVMGNVPTVHKEQVPFGNPEATANGAAEQQTTEEEQAGVQEPPKVRLETVSNPQNNQEVSQDVRAASELPKKERHAGNTSRSSWLLDELFDVLGSAHSDEDVAQAINTFKEAEDNFLTAEESAYIRGEMTPDRIAEASGGQVGEQETQRFLRGIGGSKQVTKVSLKPSPEPKPRLFLYGGDRATPGVADSVRQKTARFFKRQMPVPLMAAVGAATNDGQLEVYHNPYPGAVNWENPGRDSVEMIASGNGVVSKTIFGKENGKMVMKISLFKIDDDSPYKSTGYEFFANQVDALRKMGVTRVYLHAAGDADDAAGYNGYYSWPRYGFDGTISRVALEKLPPEIRQQLGNSRSVFDLFSIPGGKEAWMKYGNDIVDTFFDLTPGSRNMQRLEEYIRERKAKGSK